MIKHVAEVPLADIPNALALREVLDKYADDNGNRVIAERAVLTVKTTTSYPDRPGTTGTSTTTPVALVFTWEDEL